jgi:hypothetical protein
MQKTFRHLLLPLLALTLAACNHTADQAKAASSRLEAAQDEGDSSPEAYRSV